MDRFLFSHLGRAQAWLDLPVVLYLAVGLCLFSATQYALPRLLGHQSYWLVFSFGFAFLYLGLSLSLERLFAQPQKLEQVIFRVGLFSVIVSLCLFATVYIQGWQTQEAMAILGLYLVLSFHVFSMGSRYLAQPLQSLLVQAEGLQRVPSNHYYDHLSCQEVRTLCSRLSEIGQKLEKNQSIEKSFGAYVDKKVADKIVEGARFRDSLQSKKTHATVLFVDIRGFTSLVEEISPEETMKILNEYFQLMVEIVKKYDGTVDKFIGDNLMATWGVPDPVMNSEKKAVLAGLEMIEASSQLMASRYRAQSKIQIGIGIHTGEVISGNVGGAGRMDYTVVGDVVNTAQRTESVAKPGELLITAAVQQKLQLPVSAQPLEPMPVKGKTEPLQLFRISDLDQNFVYSQSA